MTSRTIETSDAISRALGTLRQQIGDDLLAFGETRGAQLHRVACRRAIGQRRAARLEPLRQLGALAVLVGGEEIAHKGERGVEQGGAGGIVSNVGYGSGERCRFNYDSGP